MHTIYSHQKVQVTGRSQRYPATAPVRVLSTAALCSIALFLGFITVPGSYGIGGETLLATTALTCLFTVLFVGSESWSRRHLRSVYSDRRDIAAITGSTVFFMAMWVLVEIASWG